MIINYRNRVLQGSSPETDQSSGYIKPDRIIGMSKNEVVPQWQNLHAGIAYLPREVHECKQTKNPNAEW